jgi:hypothetical protein
MTARRFLVLSQATIRERNGVRNADFTNLKGDAHKRNP